MKTPRIQLVNESDLMRSERSGDTEAAKELDRREAARTGGKNTPHFNAPVSGHWSSDEGTEMANSYAVMKREDLAYGHKSDLEMANAIYMADRHSLDLLMLQTAAKDRIRWLSAQLAIANSEKTA